MPGRTSGDVGCSGDIAVRTNLRGVIGRRPPRIAGPYPRHGDLAELGAPFESLAILAETKREGSKVVSPHRGPTLRGSPSR
jgi:hypothetical protein